MRDAILGETRVQADATEANARLTLGLASQADIRKVVVAALPASVRAHAELTEAFRKQNEQLAMNNHVAAAALPGLKQLELQSSDLRTQLDTLGTNITNGISNPLVDMASGAATAGDAFKSMGQAVLRSISQMIINMTIAAPIAKGLQSILGGFLGFSNGGVFSGGKLTPNANGNVFGANGLIPFADGGIVTMPTPFSFGGGKRGIMGEAGDEAVMPLARLGNGKLGVHAQGGGTTIVQNITQDFRGVDPSQRAFLTTQIRIAAVQARQGAVVDVAKTRRDNPGYLS